MDGVRKVRHDAELGLERLAANDGARKRDAQAVRVTNIAEPAEECTVQQQTLLRLQCSVSPVAGVAQGIKRRREGENGVFKAAERDKPGEEAQVSQGSRQSLPLSGVHVMAREGAENMRRCSLPHTDRAGVRDACQRPCSSRVRALEFAAVR
jgi:hypothetical protein